jgi:hypothetical protein
MDVLLEMISKLGLGKGFGSGLGEGTYATALWNNIKVSETSNMRN